MFRNTCSVVLLLCGICLADDAPVGIVTFAQGDAQIFQPGAKAGRKLETADLLQDGSRIVTGANGKVNFVSCAQSMAAQAQPGSELQFTRGAFDVRRGKVEQQRKVPSCRIPLSNVAGKDAHVGGVNMRGETTMQLLSPVGTSVEPNNVRFRWKPVEAATNYRVAIRDEKGDEFWESESKSKNEFLVYNGTKKLQPGGSYRWRVTALQGDEVLSSASAKMKVLSPDELQHIAEVRNGAADAQEIHLLLGMLYEELNAPELALSEYEKLPPISGDNWLAKEMAGLRAQLTP